MDNDDRAVARQQAQKLLKENALLMLINTVMVVLLAGGIFKMRTVKECSSKLFMAGVLFELYMIFFLVRQVTTIAICFCIKKPLAFYWTAYSIFVAIDSVLFTTLVIWASVVLLEPEVVECRQKDVDGFTSGYWFFVAFFCVVGALYSLVLVGFCCLMTCCLCFLVIILC